MNLKIIPILIFILLSSCKQNLNQKDNNDKIKNFEKSEIIVKQEKLTINAKINSNKRLNLDFMQGIWMGETDLNQSKSYRIINKDRVIDLICIEGICDGTENNTIIQIGNIGFIDMKKNNLRKNDLKNDDKYMIYVDSIINNDLIKKFRLDDNYLYKDGDSFYQTSLTSLYMFDDENHKFTTFSKINTLNNKAFNVLKLISNQNNKDYIKEFNLKIFSQKVKIITDKTYFYNNIELKDKRKAFLVKGDIAYLENIGDNQVQVYFDGKIITSGYLKRNDVTILE